MTEKVDELFINQNQKHPESNRAILENVDKTNDGKNNNGDLLNSDKKENIVVIQKNEISNEKKIENTSNENQRGQSSKESIIIGCIFIIIQIILIILLGTLFRWEADYNPKYELIKHSTENVVKDDLIEEKYAEEYYTEVCIMIFVGFGFLYAYIATHSLSSVAINLMMGILGVETSIITNHLWECAFQKKCSNLLYIGLITKALTNAGSLLVAFGAVIGRLSFLQYAVMSILGCFFITFNTNLCEGRLGILDTGGSLYVHAFGAIFGDAVSIALSLKSNEKTKFLDNHHKGGNQISNLVAFVGTVFLWVYWPYFNICMTESNIQRGSFNTIFALCGSCMGAGITSLMLNKGRLDIEHMLNSTFAGGVIIGGSCTVCGYFWAALLVGFLGGAISSLCFAKLHPVTTNLGLLDTAGVLNIHGIPGILGGLCTCIFVGSLRTNSGQLWNPYTKDLEVKTYQHIYRVGFSEYTFIRTKGQQAGYEIAGIVITICIAILSGLLVGFIMRLISIGKNNNYFSDEEHFKPEELEEEQKEKKD